MRITHFTYRIDTLEALKIILKNRSLDSELHERADRAAELYAPNKERTDHLTYVDINGNLCVDVTLLG